MTEAFSRKTLASLIPRQIMLGTAFSKEDSIKESKGKKMDETMAVMGIEDMEKKKKKKKEKNSSFKMSNTVGMCPELADTRAIDYPNGDVLPWKGNGRDDLLRSIDAFLESSGFVKTLSVFRSEAQIEVTKRGSFINLEDLFEKSSWPSKRDSVANIEWSKEQDTGKLIPEVTDDLDVKTKKKKRKVKEAFGSSELENAEKNHLGAALLTTQLSRKLMKKEKHSGEDESGPRSGAKAQEVLGQVRGSKRDLVANIEWTKERGMDFLFLGLSSSWYYDAFTVFKFLVTLQYTNIGKFIIDAVDDSDVKTKDKKRKINQVFGSFELGNAKKSSMGAPLRPEDSDFQIFLVNKDTALDEKDASKENFDELKNLNNNPIIGIDSAVINKSGKNRKKKEAKQPLEQFRQGGSQEAFAKEPDDGKSFASTKHQESVNSDNMANEFHKNVGNFKKAKRKTKKKMEEVTTAYSLHTDSSDKLVDETCGGVEKLDNGSLQKIDIVKDSIAVSKENASDGEATTNNKKKRSSTKETEKHFEITASNSKHAKLEVTKGEKVITDQKILYCNESLPLKQKSNEPSKELFICLDKHEENSALQDSLEQLNGFHSGNVIIEKHANEGSAMPNSMKKERHSGEQRGLNAFQRVKVDEIKFADERLQDNSYWALDETGSGYGAKAQEVLGQVRGRNFRHEKTKKKRGTYRGGQIDLESHSIKFNYSDDD